MKFRFEVNPSLCTGCRTCELACAFAHAQNQKPGRSRIYPLAYEPDKYVPVACLQCDDAACVKSCMFDALKRNEVTGAVELDRERCIKCMACVAACPFGCALLDDVQDEIVKCDLCGGNPACATFCPTKALAYKKI
ncbi:MAG: 4Fe-4S dicluster domain-containing protein [Candidatus Zixiibacteriota bacterium]|nr:MAG: 4Fe-4S dicluster domain-containing protein [candidate division Zixibacteria bacterium]